MMKLGLFLAFPGHHVAAWRHPDASPLGGLDFRYVLELVELAERSTFDLVFLSDGVGVRTNYKDEDELSRWGRVVHFEPITLLSALATRTSHIGLAATASTSYNEPFHVARKFASLDFLSNGRAGWNVVTSVTDLEAQNFNREKQLDHTARYRRAREFMTVVNGLWDSWEDDAFIADKQGGRLFHPSKLHILHHKGDTFSVRGPLNVARSPQGRPVIIQAGSSDDGQDFAASIAEIVFTAQQIPDQAVSFARGLKARVETHGRSGDQVVVMPGMMPFVGRTKSEAEDKFDQLQRLIDPVVGLGMLAGQLGDIDVSGFALDAPLPELPSTEGSLSRQRLIYDQARREGLTVRQLYQKVSASRGHLRLVGTATDIANVMQQWFESGAADGFNIMPALMPGGLRDFTELVVPELRRRKLFRDAYDSVTLRGHLGLPRPSHFAVSHG
jgi:alkanesulfonate monooxygenase